ncbi:MAG: PDGLE domain-containing protein [Nocardioides sp.]|nr:PDGLE domain-containing protein [Nocardioides sp.]
MKRNAKLLVTLLVASFLIAGVASFYASSHPDGLEYVAEKTGFMDSAEDSPTADSPFADYGVKGVDDERISGGLAGVIGCVAVLGLAGGLFFLIGRRGSADDEAKDESDTEKV